MSNTEWWVSLINPCPFWDFWTSLAYCASHVFSKQKSTWPPPFSICGSCLTIFVTLLWTIYVYLLYILSFGEWESLHTVFKVWENFRSVLWNNKWVFWLVIFFLIKKGNQMLEMGLYYWTGGFMELPVIKNTPPPPHAKIFCLVNK